MRNLDFPCDETVAQGWVGFKCQKETEALLPGVVSMVRYPQRPAHWARGRAASLWHWLAERVNPIKGPYPFTFLSVLFMVQPLMLNWVMNRCPFLSSLLCLISFLQNLISHLFKNIICRNGFW